MSNVPEKASNEFVTGQPGTSARTAAEYDIEQLRQKGGIFVDAVKATRMPMAVTDPTLPGNPIVFANASMLALTGYTMAEVLGQQPFFMNGPDTDPEDAARFRSALEQGQDVEVETFQYGKDGKRMCLSVFCRAFRDDRGRVTNHFLSYIDITRRIEAEATAIRQAQQLEQRVEERTRELIQERARLREAEDRFRLIVEGARDYAIFTTDPEGKISDWHKGAETVFGWTREEAVGQPVAMTFTPEDRAADAPNWEREVAASKGSAPNVRWHIRKDGSRVFIEGNMTSLRTPDGALRGFLKIGQDMTDRRAAEQRQETLLLELQHRVRNTLAVIRSMAGRTARTSDSVEAYREHLEGRIDALARTQAQLTKSAGAALSLHQLIQEEFDAQAAQPGQVSLEGPSVTLAPKAAEVTALAIHELATNAAKYGALTVPSGRVSVTWRIEPDGGEIWLRLSWVESGVRVPPATRRGFGTELVAGRVPYELGGRGALSIDDDGAKARIEFPLRPGDSILQTDASQLLKIEDPVR